MSEAVAMIEASTRQLVDRLANPLPAKWRLSRTETKIVLALALHGRCTLEDLNEVSGASHGGRNIVRVRVNGIRDKLKPFGIRIVTIWKVGYELTQPSIRIIEQARAPHA